MRIHKTGSTGLMSVGSYHGQLNKAETMITVPRAGKQALD